QGNEHGLIQVNPDPVIRGREAWGRLKKSLADWFAVAEALHHGQHLAMLEARTTVWRAWRKSTLSGRVTVTAHPSPIAKYKDEIARLKNETHVRRRAGDDLSTATDTAIDIARLLADRLLRVTPSKARQILELLPELYAERLAKPPHDKARPP